MLQPAGNSVTVTVLDKIRTGLFKLKRHAGGCALVAQPEHPGKIAGSGRFAGFAAGDDLADSIRQIGG